MFRSGLFLLAILFSSPALGSTQNIADRIYYGGDIVTADEANPAAEAVAIGDGRIIGVGNLAEVVRMRGANTELIDLEGRTLAPGFIDAHGHLSRAGLQAISANLLRPPHGRSRTVAGLIHTLRQWLKESGEAGEIGLVLGFGFDESQLTGRRWLTRDDLDAVSKNLPVIAIHRSGNLSVFNSRALELAGIGATTPNPQGGVIYRRKNSGEPNGVLGRAAHRKALHTVLTRIMADNLVALIDAGQQLYVRYGHTTAQDARPGQAALAAYPEIAATGRLKIDIVAYPDLIKNRNQPALNGPFHSREYFNGFRIGGVMLRLDGALRPETARLRASYLRPGAGPLKNIGGEGTFEDGEAAALFTSAFRQGWQVITYAEGGSGLDQFTTAVESANASVPGADHRPVLLQRRPLSAERIESLRELGVVPALLLSRVSAQSASLPLGGMIAHGMPFTACHDAPAARPEILHVLLAGGQAGGNPATATVSGTSRADMLRAITLWAAYQYGEEETKGSISEGKLADLVILSANPLTADPRTLARAHVIETIKEGETVYLRPSDGKGGGPDYSRSCADSDACFAGLTATLERARSAPAYLRQAASPDGRSASLERP